MNRDFYLKLATQKLGMTMGRLATKSFYSDGALWMAHGLSRARALADKMDVCGHPFILGSECGILFVWAAQEKIRRKVDAMTWGAIAA